ncbi:MAG: toprim domain-containing protein [Actinomycetota bacterium]
MAADAGTVAYEFMKLKYGLVDRDIIRSARLEAHVDGIGIPYVAPDGKPCLSSNGRPYVKRRLFEPVEGRKYDNPRGAKPFIYAAPGAWDARRVGLTEGEFDALVVTQAGLCCFATGGSSIGHDARARIIEVLCGKDGVTLVPDNDDAGQRFAEKFMGDLFGRVDLFTVEVPKQ